jgi:hypothetical protein
VNGWQTHPGAISRLWADIEQASGAQRWGSNSSMRWLGWSDVGDLQREQARNSRQTGRIARGQLAAKAQAERVHIHMAKVRAAEDAAIASSPREITPPLEEAQRAADDSEAKA